MFLRFIINSRSQLTKNLRNQLIKSSQNRLLSISHMLQFEKLSNEAKIEILKKSVSEYDLNKFSNTLCKIRLSNENAIELKNLINTDKNKNILFYNEASTITSGTMLLSLIHPLLLLLSCDKIPAFPIVIFGLGCFYVIPAMIFYNIIIIPQKIYARKINILTDMDNYLFEKQSL